VPEETEPPIREFADRGVLWLLESPRNLHDLVALLSQQIAEHLDFDRAERVNRSFIPEDLHKRDASERSLLVETIEEALEPRHEREREEILMTGAQELILQGKKIGREEGKAEGREEGKVEGRVSEARALLLRLGNKRFGPPQEKILTELSDANSIERLEGLLDRMLDVESWEELLSAE
jgi:flagellar biosynthesis/type III secretory pathway protein FliH